jgi:hypothetical protein
MDGSAFRHLPLQAIFGWPVLTLLFCGLLSIVGSVAALLWWLISHLAWV